MPAWPNVFATLAGDVAASKLDENFNAAAFASDVAALTAVVAGLPSSSTPLVPVAGGDDGVAATLSKSDHQHPPQSATPNAQTGTTYTLLATDDGKVVELSNAAGITLTFPNNMAQGASGLVVQMGVGQVTCAAAGGATLNQRSGYTKTAGRYGGFTWYVSANVGGSSAVYVLIGDMSA